MFGIFWNAAVRNKSQRSQISKVKHASHACPFRAIYWNSVDHYQSIWERTSLTLLEKSIPKHASLYTPWPHRLDLWTIYLRCHSKRLSTQRRCPMRFLYSPQTQPRPSTSSSSHSLVGRVDPRSVPWCASISTGMKVLSL